VQAAFVNGKKNAFQETKRPYERMTIIRAQNTGKKS
jgi:hypothetical protein